MQNLRSTFRTRTEEQAMACNRQQHPFEGQKNQLPDTLLKTEVKSLAPSPVSYLYHFLKLCAAGTREAAAPHRFPWEQPAQPGAAYT